MRLALTGRPLQLAEIALVFGVPIGVAAGGWSLVGDNALARQGVVWVAYLLALGLIWLGLRIRGQSWAHFGLGVRRFGWITALKRIGQSVLVLIGALLMFNLGAAVAQLVATVPAAPNMDSYDYLRGNLPMLLMALASVYVASSFGEEVIYRGFLLTRLAELGGGSRVAWALSAVLGSAVFGLAHFDWGIVGMFQTGFMGLGLAVAFLLVGRNLWVLILAHAYLDTALLVSLYLAPASHG